MPRLRSMGAMTDHGDSNFSRDNVLYIKAMYPFLISGRFAKDRVYIDLVARILVAAYRILSCGR